MKSADGTVTAMERLWTGWPLLSPTEMSWVLIFTSYVPGAVPPTPMVAARGIDDVPLTMMGLPRLNEHVPSVKAETLQVACSWPVYEFKGVMTRLAVPCVPGAMVRDCVPESW